jgi:hypothetical protein
MAVFIDIPGIGNIEAKNAASEATLRDILRAIQSSSRGASRGASSAGAGSANSLGLIGKSAGGTATALGKMAGALGMATGAVIALGEGTVKVVQAMANVGDSVENAANLFSSLPLIGTLFGAVASASQKVNDSYLAAAAGGASFAGSMNQFVATATAAGMTMEKFGQFVSQNGQAMLGLGSTVEEGAKRFGQVSKGLRAVSGDLYALGFSTQEINQGLANYTAQLRVSGRQGTQNNSELIVGSKRYLREMDLLAKITGESRAEKEKEREQLIQDGQFRMAMAKLGPKVEASTATLIQSLPKELQNLAKDVVSTGSVTRAANMGLAAQYPGLVSQMQALHRQTQANVVVGKDQVAQTLKVTKADARASADRNGTALAANEELADEAVGVAAGLRINADAVEKATAEQQNSAESTDKMNEQMQQAQQSLAAISNEFTMYLANSGILEVMLDAFKTIVNFVRSYIVPAFNLLTTGVQSVWQLLTGAVGPALLVMKQFLTEVGYTIFEFGKFVWNATAPLRELAMVLNQKLMPVFIKAYDLVSDGFRAVSDVAQDVLRPAFDLLGRIVSSVIDILKNDFRGALDTVSTFMDTYFIKPFIKVANYVNEEVVPIFEPVVRFFTELKDRVVRVLASFNSVSDITDSLKLGFQNMQISLQKLILWVDEKTTFFANDEEKADFEKRKQEIAELEKQNIEARTAQEVKLHRQATENLEAAAAKQQQIDKDREARDAKITYERGQRDKKITDLQLANASASIKATVGLSDVAKNLGQATQQSSNYNDSIALAGIEYARNNPGAAPSAESARSAVSNQSAQPATTEQTGTQSSPGSRSPSGIPPTRPQESTESLLANLNSKMDQLIQINRQVFSVNERQLTVQQSMTGDLFIAT